MPPEAAEVRRWLEKASHDRRAARALLAQTPPITDAAAFHCQQAVEKLLKGFLVHWRDPFERIHDLEELLDQCAKRDPSLSPLRHRVAPLTAYAVRFRYPGATDPTVEQVRSALEIVAEVWTLVLDRLPGEVRP